MYTQFKRVCCILVCVLLALLQIPNVVSAQEAPIEEEPISVSVSIREYADNRYLVTPLTLSCPGGTTAAGLFPILEKYAYLESYQMAEDILLAITVLENGEPELTGGNGRWLLRINGTDIEPNNLPLLSDGDVLEWIYFADQPEEDSPNPGEPQPGAPSLNTAGLWNETFSAALSGACTWLRNNGSSNQRFISLGAAGVSVDYQEIDNFVRSIQANSEYKTSAEVAQDILAATFCGIYAGDVSGVNLLQTLANYPDIARGGSSGAILSLLAVDSNGYLLPADSINTRSTLQTVILSAQNDDGGFAADRNGESSPYLTAYALTALSRYNAYEEIRQILQDGFAYLSALQLPDGSFPATEEYSAAETTAAVLTALCAAGISPSNAEFTKSGGSLTDALLTFSTDAGGFSAEPGGLPEESATQQAILAMMSLKGSRSAYILRTAIKGENATPSLAEKNPPASSKPSEETSEPAGDNPPKSILIGGLSLTAGITIGIALGAILLIILRSRHKKEKKENPHEN